MQCTTSHISCGSCLGTVAMGTTLIGGEAVDEECGEESSKKVEEHWKYDISFMDAVLEISTLLLWI